MICSGRSQSHHRRFPEAPFRHAQNSHADVATEGPVAPERMRRTQIRSRWKAPNGRSERTSGVPTTWPRRTTPAAAGSTSGRRAGTGVRPPVTSSGSRPKSIHVTGGWPGHGTSGLAWIPSRRAYQPGLHVRRSTLVTDRRSGRLVGDSRSAATVRVGVDLWLVQPSGDLPGPSGNSSVARRSLRREMFARAQSGLRWISLHSRTSWFRSEKRCSFSLRRRLRSSSTHVPSGWRSCPMRSATRPRWVATSFRRLRIASSALSARSRHEASSWAETAPIRSTARA